MTSNALPSRTSSPNHKRVKYLWLRRFWSKHGLAIGTLLTFFIWFCATLQSHILAQGIIHGQTPLMIPPPPSNHVMQRHRSPLTGQQTSTNASDGRWSLPEAFESILERARHARDSCISLAPQQALDTSLTTLVGDEQYASLPSFGIIETLESWKTTENHPEADALIHSLKLSSSQADSPHNWHCQLPPEEECEETMLTTVIMAYNPDRLEGVLHQIKTFLQDKNWQKLIYQVILVWNGERSIEDSKEGKELISIAQTEPETFRVVYPLKMGLENDLMNRYHPRVLRIEKTKAILYYDDDGPYYSYSAVQAAFELWKRHPRSQLAAMSRHFIQSIRQQTELQNVQSQHPGQSQDDLFISHCTNVDDHVEYDFHYFANFDAHMALPSGSLLHVNFLCFLWHPVLEPVRKFVRAHPVHPDDVTVSMIVSQLSGRAPRTYSRRLNPPSEKDNELLLQKRREWQLDNQRRLSELVAKPIANETADDVSPFRRRLEGIGGVNWDEKLKRKGADEEYKREVERKKQMWADLRTQAVNSVVRYFGSLSGGSIGWCQNTPFYSEQADGRCHPNMAKQGWLTWMKPDGTPKETCP